MTESTHKVTMTASEHGVDIQMQPMNDKARAHTVLNTPVPDYVWDAMAKANAAISDLGEVFPPPPASPQTYRGPQ